ncbi:hypothetical protein ACWDUL_26635 [Nocardia niigatensis]|uniref:hypothetical protein n=1 Tax=Nocardia niigatensis TaxID=209249 RepID=UPI0002DDAB63|nr:hypothetical protein [Nocardia niigatensis]
MTTRNEWVIWRARHCERWVRFADGRWYADEETTRLFNAPGFTYELIDGGRRLSGPIRTAGEAFTAARYLFGSVRYTGTPPPPPAPIPEARPGWRH